MRGKRCWLSLFVKLNRITPADAGKTILMSCPKSPKADHPRGCGENNFIDAMTGGTKGSPPRMRGKPAGCPRRVSRAGITPADAGKTDNYRARRARQRDHPRGCGENCAVTQEQPAKTGSPPRMRGKPFASSGVAPCLRITPADAGKTSCWSRSAASTWDHPRGCGENVKIKRQDDTYRGSPPRMRGKRLCASDTAGHARITPADAGKTDDEIVTLHNN